MEYDFPPTLHDQNVATVITDYWSGHHGKSNHCERDGMTSYGVVATPTNTNICQCAYPHKMIILLAQH